MDAGRFFPIKANANSTPNPKSEPRAENLNAVSGDIVSQILRVRILR